MKKQVVLALGVIAAGSLSSAAFAGTMEETFGNTVLMTNAAGETSKSWPKADGTYTSEGPKGEKVSGTWVIKDGKICSTPSLPPDAKPGTPAPTESCSEYQADHKVGDKWTQSDATGAQITVEIVQGM
jgi:hypothetical protein